MLPGGSILMWGGGRQGTIFLLFVTKVTMSGPHYISLPNCRVTGYAPAEYLSPDDVVAFRAAILDAGVVLGILLTTEYPRAELVSEALYAVTKVVGVYGLEGKWVMSWASDAQSEFLATSEVQEVSSSVTFVRSGLHFLCCSFRSSI